MTKDIDASYTDQIVCPYCGYEFTDSWDCGATGEPECPECGKVFNFTSEVQVYYTSERDCGLNGEEHDWVHVRDLPCHSLESCKHCDQRRFVDHEEQKEEVLPGGVRG